MSLRAYLRPGLGGGRPPVAPPVLGPDGEPEIDFRRWSQALFARWWLVASGLVIGLIIGGLYSLSGPDTYSATVTIQPAQPFSSDGNSVLNYSSSPLAIQVLVNSTGGLADAATAAGMPFSALKGHVHTGSVYTGTGAVVTRGTVLIQITVTLPQKQEAERAANALGLYVRQQTEGVYVRRALATYAQLARSYTQRLATVNALISSYQASLAKAKLLDPIDKLLLASELNDQISNQGALEDSQLANQQSWTLAQNVEVAQILDRAVGQKPAPPSGRNSLLFGGLIGLFLGALAALALGLRPPRASMG